MQAAGTIPRGGLSLDDLGDVFERPGPFATVYLGTDPHIENAEQRSQQRWRALRDQLAADGAPDGCLDGIEELVGAAHLAGEAMAVIADESGVLAVHHLDQPLDQDRARWGRSPTSSRCSAGAAGPTSEPPSRRRR